MPLSPGLYNNRHEEDSSVHFSSKESIDESEQDQDVDVAFGTIEQYAR